MTKTYICSACGQEINEYKKQCPFCTEPGNNLIELNNEDFFDYESNYDDTE